MFSNTQNKICNFFLSLVVLAVVINVPGFSRPQIANAATETTSQIVVDGENVFVVKLKDLDVSIFSGDTKVTSIEKLFGGSKNELLKNIFDIKTSNSLAEFKTKYADKIVYVEPEHKMRSATITVNDPGFSLDPTNTDREWHLWKANFVKAWEKSRGNTGVRVAIIDTGIDGTHEDLSSGQVVEGYDFITKTIISANTNSDNNGHGTIVAALIGATQNNFRGIAGVNAYVSLVPIKALDGNGSGNSGDIAEAIVWAADHNVNVVNMSLGGVGFANDTTLSNAITYAFNKGVVIVAAAGNDVAVNGGNLDITPVFPICDDNGQNMVIGVAATDLNDQKAQFSNYGRACVDVSAPGKRILSATNHDPLTKAYANNAYAYASGTSLAAPLVSAEAALIKAYYPNASNKEIRDRIIKSAISIDSSNLSQCNNGPCTDLIGKGRVDAYAALADNPAFSAATIKDGDLVQLEGTGDIYLISGAKKMFVSSFVRNQRFPNILPAVVSKATLDTYATGSYALPNEGTLVRSSNSFTVYQIVEGIKRPIRYQIFLQRKYEFPNVNVITEAEVNSWVTGTFLPPTDGTLVKIKSNPTVYWVVQGVLHPINRGFYLDRGLNIFPIMIIPDNDLKGFAQGNAYIR